MNFTTKLVIAGLILTGGVALAEASDPDVKARQALMDANGHAMKTLMVMATGDAAFDATKAQAALKTLADNAAAIPEAFKNQGAADPEAEASPEVWTNWDDFLAKAKAMGDATAAVDGSGLDGVKAGLGEIGGTCKACHKAYKAG